LCELHVHGAQQNNYEKYSEGVDGIYDDVINMRSKPLMLMNFPCHSLNINGLPAAARSRIWLFIGLGRFIENGGAKTYEKTQNGDGLNRTMLIRSQS